MEKTFATEALQARRSRKQSWRLHSDLTQIALRRSCSDRSPLYDVRNPASDAKGNRKRSDVSRTSNRRCPNGASCEHTMKKGGCCRDRCDRSPPHQVSGGGRRDRTDDLMLAKHALSQLSYAPVPEPRLRQVASPGIPATLSSSVAVPREAEGEAWWAWEDLNFRPHAYQARALTN